MLFEKNQNPKLAIIVPCYNEQEVIKSTIERLLQILNELIETNFISRDSFLYFVDDGSSDDTFEIISAYNRTTCRGNKRS